MGLISEGLPETVAAVEGFTREYGVTSTVAAAAASLSWINTLTVAVERGMLTETEANTLMTAAGMGTALICLAYKAQAEQDWQD